MTRRFATALVLIGAAITMLFGVQSASAAKTVEISGRAFIFNHMSTGISNATIKVREFPKLSTVTDALGDYKLKVPDKANVTPYILSGGPVDLVQRNKDGEPTGTMADTHWNEIDLQTFHTRGEAIENANFQAPRDIEYNGLKAILAVPSREDGRPEQCAIVTTASARNVRDVDFRTYWLNTPHGVPGATSVEYPSIDGPVYFNHLVIPDKTQMSTSEDGGIIWPVVPTGTYRIVTSSPNARFASFLATCAPGRIVNANPPMGAYQLNPGEKPRTFSNVAASLESVKASRVGRNKRLINVKIDSGESIAVQLKIRKAGKLIATRNLKNVASPRIATFVVSPKVKPGRFTVSAKLTDVTKVSFTDTASGNLPKVVVRKKSAKKPGKRK